MQSYAKGKDKLNWFEVLTKKYKEEGAIGNSDEDLTQKAGTWPSCAVGNSCSLLKRNQDGEPHDSELYELGVEFAEKVSEANWPQSLGLFTLIEQRTAELVHKILKRRKQRKLAQSNIKLPKRDKNGRFQRKK